MRHDATSSTAAKPLKMRRLGLEPTCCRWIRTAQCPQNFRPDVASALKSWGICRVVTGHTPLGNAPTVFSNHEVSSLAVCGSF